MAKIRRVHLPVMPCKFGIFRQKETYIPGMTYDWKEKRVSRFTLNRDTII